MNEWQSMDGWITENGQTIDNSLYNYQSNLNKNQCSGIYLENEK